MRRKQRTESLALGRMPAVVLLASLMLSCAAAPEENYSVVKVFYGTDREWSEEAHHRDKYGGDRGDGIRYGECEVSIPRDHRLGELESPSIWRLEFREDPEKHVVLLGGVEYPRDEFLEELSSRVASSSGKKALVFVHGYRVTFEDSAKRTAQMSYDLTFDGVPIFFSWPSKGKTTGYSADETDIEWATPHIREFLTDVAKHSGAEAIYLIAHSMGNRGLTKALLGIDPELRKRFQEVILTAPDIDADVFRRDILPAMQAANTRITLYASSNDRALLASKALHKNPRAGDAGTSLIVAPGLDTIDASSVETNFLGHSYYAENRSVISDLFNLIKHGQPPSQRFGLAPGTKDGLEYWEFKE